MNRNQSIETVHQGQTITKTCVEDVHKIVDRVSVAIFKAVGNTGDFFGKIEDPEGHYSIVGIGTSCPCGEDEYDEEIGNNIAFMKAKLNANIKKRNLCIKVYNEFVDVLDALDEEIDRLEILAQRDLDGIREYNPEYLEDFEVVHGFTN